MTKETKPVKAFMCGVFFTILAVSLTGNYMFCTGKLDSTVSYVQPTEKNRQIISVFDPVDYPTKYAKTR